jgi:hypothetical protein
MKMVAAALAVCFGLSGCATGYTSLAFKRVDSGSFDDVRSWPPTGQETTVHVGETMISAMVVPVMPAVTLAAPFRQVGVYRRDLRMALDVPPGAMQLDGTDGAGGRFYAAAVGVRLAYEDKGSFEGDGETMRGGVFVAGNGAKSIYWFWPGTATASTIPAPTLEVGEATVELPARDARFQKQLIYSGLSQTTVGVLYREMADSMARPAFNQDLRYELSKGQTIGYQRARFEVLDASNTSIRYRVLAPLEIDSSDPALLAVKAERARKALQEVDDYLSRPMPRTVTTCSTRSGRTVCVSE